MRHSLLLAGLIFVGCAHQKPEVRKPSEEDDMPASMRASAAEPAAAPAQVSTSVKITGKEPPSDRWELVGKISGEASTDDTTEAGIAAEKDLKKKALRLGAALVKIDQITPPADKGKRGKVTVFVARAFRERAQD
jgi:hypothetical protein